MKILNPFDYGGPVSGNQFAGRVRRRRPILCGMAARSI